MDLYAGAHRASKWRCPGGWYCGCQSQTSNKDLEVLCGEGVDSQERAQSNGSINVSGT